MNSADLKDRIDIYEQIDNATEFGRTDISYKFKYSTRARVNYVSGNTTMDNDEIFYAVNRTFIVRHYVPIAYTDVIKYDNDFWQVTSIDNVHEYHNIVINTVRLNDGVRIKPNSYNSGIGTFDNNGDKY